MEIDWIDVQFTETEPHIPAFLSRKIVELVVERINDKDTLPQFVESVWRDFNGPSSERNDCCLGHSYKWEGDDVIAWTQNCPGPDGEETLCLFLSLLEEHPDRVPVGAAN